MNSLGKVWVVVHYKTKEVISVHLTRNADGFKLRWDERWRRAELVEVKRSIK